MSSRKGEASAQLIDHLNKPEMAKEAGRLLADSWVGGHFHWRGSFGYRYIRPPKLKMTHCPAGRRVIGGTGMLQYSGRAGQPASDQCTEASMLRGRLVGAIAVFAALCIPLCAAYAFDDSKYPNFKGQWARVGVGATRWPAEEAPLTPEYQAIYKENLKDQEEGGIGNWPSSY